MAAALIFHPPENSSFFANSPGNVCFKKSVKYNFKTGINDKGAETAARLGPPPSKSRSENSALVRLRLW
jgi:hypothetical protein